MAYRSGAEGALFAIDNDGCSPHEAHKQLLYGTDSPTLTEEIQRAAELLPNLDVARVATHSRSFERFVDQLRALPPMP